MNTEELIHLLPYQDPFLFVGEIEAISEAGVTGSYTFNEEAFFYEGHFKNNPITPGVILTECMAQIGLVCLGIYLLADELTSSRQPQIALTANQMDFYLPVLPGEKVTVVSEKEVFRFNKLKCKVKMLNSKGDLVARGLISGMLKA